MTKQEMEKRLEELKKAEFFHAMKDRWNAKDFDYDRRISREIRELEEALKNV